MSVKVLLDNGMVEETIVKTFPRYEGKTEYSQFGCEDITNDFVTNNKIWITDHEREGFKGVYDTKENWEPQGSVEDDIESFQKYLDETYGKDKYEAYALGAYIHGAVSFMLSKGPDNRCRWDSGTVGFVGINKEMTYDITKLSNMISDAWNGYVEEIHVYDNFNEEIVDSIYSTESQEDINKWKDHMKKAYGVEEYKDNNHN